MDYPGKVITKNQVTPSQTSASGVWTVDDAAAAVENNSWPVAGVPNPISRSLRFNSADSAYLNRTPATAGNRKTWTWSGWVKRSGLDSTRPLFAAYIGSGSTDNQFFSLFFDGGTLRTSGYSTAYLVTTAVYRDPSAWYHIVCSVDTTSATANNRIRLYVNGIEVTVFSTRNNPTQNTDLGINQAAQHEIGQNGGFGSYFSGYQTEVHFIDGQALTPTSFGMTDPVTGAWIPKAYNGTYGTNGFYLNFSNNSSTAALGTDYSGNSNTWTTNNFSVTAGAGNDSLTDVPTPWIAYNTTGDVGGVVRGNYATLNPLDKGSAANPVLQNGNLDLVGADSSFDGIRSTFGITSSKWYWEAKIASIGAETRTGAGIYLPTDNLAGDYGNGKLVIFEFSGTVYISDETGGGSSIYFSTPGSLGANDIIGFAFDADSGKVWVSKNGTYYNSGAPASGTGQVATLSTGLTYFAGGWAFNSSDKMEFNFGQRPFAYTPPAGFLSLCTTNLPTPTILDGGDYFNTVLWTGTGSGTTRAISGVGFQPDFVWAKVRSAAYSHTLYDAVRGGGAEKELQSNTTAAEGGGNPDQYGYLSSFDSDGFTSTAGTAGAAQNLYFNESGSTYVAWNWKAGGTPAVTNTVGTITSTVSVNTTSGFSIVTYTGTGNNATVGHGIGVAPSMVIVKLRSGGANWMIWHRSLNLTDNQFLEFNSNSVQSSGTAVWDVSEFSSSVIGLGSNGDSNGSGSTYVAYCFAAVPGFSAFGSYTGNGNVDGTFVYTGFKPRFVLIKRSSTGTSFWYILDSARSTYNEMADELCPDLSNAENTVDGNTKLDFVSNGFKMRTTGGEINVNGSTYIYAAFAENPFKYSNAR